MSLFDSISSVVSSVTSAISNAVSSVASAVSQVANNVSSAVSSVFSGSSSSSSNSSNSSYSNAFEGSLPSASSPVDTYDSDYSNSSKSVLPSFDNLSTGEQIQQMQVARQKEQEEQSELFFEKIAQMAKNVLDTILKPEVKSTEEVKENANDKETQKDEGDKAAEGEVDKLKKMEQAEYPNQEYATEINGYAYTFNPATGILTKDGNEISSYTKEYSSIIDQVGSITDNDFANAVKQYARSYVNAGGTLSANDTNGSVLTPSGVLASTDSSVYSFTDVNQLNSLISDSGLWATDWQFASILENVGSVAGHSSSKVSASSKWADIDNKIVAITLNDFKTSQTIYVDVSKINTNGLTNINTGAKSAEKGLSANAGATLLNSSTVVINNNNTVTQTSKGAKITTATMSDYLTDENISSLLKSTEENKRPMVTSSRVASIHTQIIMENNKQYLNVKMVDFNKTESYKIDIDKFRQGTTTIANESANYYSSDFSKTDIQNLIKDANAHDGTSKGNWNSLGLGTVSLNARGDGYYDLIMQDGSKFVAKTDGTIV